MSILPLLIAPDPRLKRKAAAVDEVDTRIVRLMDDMLETMYHSDGIGLAAPQVDVLERVVVVDVAPREQPRTPLCLANPVVVWASEELTACNEGCLSLPDQYADVVRPKQVGIRYLDRENQEQVIEANGLLAVCLQHEIDHLDGILFVDHISALRRGMILRKLQKQRRNAASG